MSGAIFVIGIPTEKEENKLRNNITTKHVTFLNTNQETEEKQISEEGSSQIMSPVINHSKSKDLLTYGTFSKVIFNYGIISINICVNRIITIIVIYQIYYV